MNNGVNMQQYLPIGSVVLLKGGKKRAMITGYLAMPAKGENKKMYDYSGCLYPEGFISSDKILLFNHSQIAKVYHVGLSDEEEKNFKKALMGEVAKIRQQANNTSEVNG